MRVVPAIVVCGAGEDRVAHLRLPSQLGFRERGHADYVGAPTAVQVGFGARGESGALDDDVGAAAVHFGARLPGSGSEEPGQLLTERVGEADVGHQSLPEEGGGPAACAVDQLIGDDHVQRLDVLAQAADGAHTDQEFDPKRLQGVDIGARRHV